MGSIRKVLKAIALITWVIVSVILFFVFKLIPGFDEQRMPRLFHRGVCKILGLKVTLQGELSNASPLLFVSNHISYLDIFVMGQYLKGYFVAKSDVASWPVLNKLAKLQNTIFVERRGPKARQQTTILQDHLAEGRNIIFYPEGTSTNGIEVKPFKSTLFAAAETDRYDLTIQPVSITYTRLNGKGMDQATRDNFAWYGEMPFLSHFLNVLSQPVVEVELKVHQAVSFSDFEDRKALAAHCDAVVRKGLEESIHQSGSTS